MAVASAAQSPAGSAVDYYARHRLAQGSDFFPLDRVAVVVHEVEAARENQFCEQLGRTELPASTSLQLPPELPGGGRNDQLLEKGRSQELAGALADIFSSCPPNEAGHQPARSGTFHTYHGSYATKVFSPQAVVGVLNLATTFYSEAGNVLRLPVPPDGRLIIVGDTHGQLEDVLWIFFKYGLPSRSNQYLFVGDIVDRGSFGLEILLLLLCFKRDSPKSVHILRGNHEDETTALMFGFKNELESKYGQGGYGGWILRACTHGVFPVLPIAAFVSDVAMQRSLVVMHGGVPVGSPGQMKTIVIDDEVAKINRRVPSVQQRSTMLEHVYFNLLWADPLKPGQVQDSRGRGNSFALQDTEDFCKANHVCCLVRAHQVPVDGRGFAYDHNRKCVTIFSASNYTGMIGNKGGVLMCEGHAFGAKGFRPCEHLAPLWQRLAEVLENNSIVECSKEERKSVAMKVEGYDEPETMSPPGSPSSPSSLAQLRAVEDFAVSQICLHKQRLFWAFVNEDKQSTGKVPKAAWTQILTTTLDSVPNAWTELARVWKLRLNVDYIEFLHRFQILSEVQGARTTKVDAFSAMAQLRMELNDVQADDLFKWLDRDLDSVVNLDQFNRFLSEWKIQIPQWQTAAVFEAMFVQFNRNLTVEDVILAVSMISRNPEEEQGNFTWHKTAQEIGEHIVASGTSLVKFFRKWDTSEPRDGFIDLGELERALQEGVPGFEQRFSPEEVKGLMEYIDSQGVSNDRISLVEFIRALGSQQLAKELTISLLAEVLKPVYFYRPTLEATFQRYDPTSSGTISLEQFTAGVMEMNRQLELDDFEPLTDFQAKAVCEIASGGLEEVHYRSFLQSLKAVDTQKRKRMARAGADVIQSLLGGLAPSLGG